MSNAKDVLHRIVDAAMGRSADSADSLHEAIDQIGADAPEDKPARGRKAKGGSEEEGFTDG